MTVFQYRKRLVARETPVRVPGCTVRHFAGEADANAWIELRRRAFARERVGIRDWTVKDFAQELLNKPWWRPEKQWLAFADGPAPRSLVGTVTWADRGAGIDAKPAVHWLFVDPAWRRRGVARMLMIELENACYEAGHREIWLETHSQWTAAIKFYEALGYERVT